MCQIHNWRNCLKKHVFVVGGKALDESAQRLKGNLPADVGLRSGALDDLYEGTYCIVDALVECWVLGIGGR